LATIVYCQLGVVPFSVSPAWPVSLLVVLCSAEKSLVAG
jgi:hypothetical protein